ncbi:MAG: phospholipase D-like domain-containing protein [Bacteroidia bacterium]|nr:phospholipase D-like domain-containing protein [Bacteroidia bacterium]
MKKPIYSLTIILVLFYTLIIDHCLCQRVKTDWPGVASYSIASGGKTESKKTKGVFHTAKSGPVITNLTYDSIKQTSVTMFWTTESPADSKIKYMVSDSNYQALIFTDSIYYSTAVTNHVVLISNLQPAMIYKYNVISHNDGGTAVDSGYFVTQSLSTGQIQVYFNHTVDTTVSTGENANGSQNFDDLFVNQIDSAKFSIDITLWDFEYYTSISNALINAKNRGVKIRFIYNHTANTPLINSLLANGIPVLKRNFDTTYSMHNKFLIFDYRYNNNADKKYLWTGSTNVSHPQFHSDKNNIIIIQDESLCAIYTREFEEMWGSHTDMPDASRARFGTQKVDNVPHILNVAGTRMEVYFAPSDSVSVFLRKIILTKPTHSLFFCMLKFELPAIEDALHTIFNEGILIRGVFDSTNAFLSNSAYPRMKGLAVLNTWNPHADVYLDTLSGLIHHKYMIIDADTPGGNQITSTGSFNWETPAETGNDENSLTIFDARVTNLYFQEFYQRYTESGGELFVIHKINEAMPSQSSLDQNYPNPFNHLTNIKFIISKLSDVKLVVYDINGREVLTLINNTMEPGTYESTVDGISLKSGVYFYKLSSGVYSETKRMMFVK